MSIMEETADSLLAQVITYLGSAAGNYPYGIDVAEARAQRYARLAEAGEALATFGNQSSPCVFALLTEQPEGLLFGEQAPLLKAIINKGLELEEQDILLVVPAAGQECLLGS